VGPEIRIFDPEGRDLAVGQTGEVAARGDVIFPGYEDDPQATSEALRVGWFHTGDMGYRDEDGHLFLNGRLTDDQLWGREGKPARG
jgi:acyl-CoA synthetase (AMP-forming)/AMP-acid ligase II